MDEREVQEKERLFTGTSWTRNEQFEKDGYLVIPNLYDAEKLYHPVPNIRGQLNYKPLSRPDQYGNQIIYDDVERQVSGSLARYSHPDYRSAHSEIRLKIEKIIGRKLYNTYYYDRFYFEGQELVKHIDREACEISVSLHISTNLKEPWPLWIKTPDTYKDNRRLEILSHGEERSVILSPGDAMIYKGCERPHWRNPMPKQKRWIFHKKEELYYHQIFFHYVLADGQRVTHAYDAAKF